MYKNAPAGFDGGYSKMISEGHRPPLPRKPIEGDWYVAVT